MFESITDKLGDMLSALTHKSWNGKRRVAFYRRLAVYVENGKPPRESVLRLRAQVVERVGDGFFGRNNIDRVALTEISDRLANGLSLAQSLRDWASSTEVSIIKAGESSGSLPSALRSAISSRGITQRIIGKGASESFDPVIMAALGYYLAYVIGSRLIPTLLTLSNPDTWPLAAKLLYDLGTFATSPVTVYFIIIMLSIFAASVISLPKWTGKYRVYADKIPPFNVYKMLQAGQWVIGFSRLIGAGIPQTEALVMQEEYASKWLSEKLSDAAIRMRNGRELGKAFIEGGFNFPDRVLADDISAFSGSGDFPALMESMGNDFLKENEEKIVAIIKVAGVFTNIMVNAVILLMIFGMNDIQTIISAGH